MEPYSFDAWAYNMNLESMGYDPITSDDYEKHRSQYEVFCIIYGLQCEVRA
jgi:hypothetical protein